jgi:tubulin-specific chaperone C
VSAVVDALRLRNLTDCRVLAAPVRGSVYVENCTGCTVMAAGRQLRVHDTHATDFYVHTLSGPIIEGCTGVR